MFTIYLRAFCSMFTVYLQAILRYDYAVYRYYNIS